MTEQDSDSYSYQRRESELKKEWGKFIEVFGGPWVIILLIATGVLMYLSSITPAGSVPPSIDIFFTLVIALFSGFLGGVITDRWSKINDTSILVTRGKSAIRGLKLLLNNVSALEKRLERYLLIASEDNEGHDIIRMTYEEIIQRCYLLQEESINAIEEWQDIIPEAANLKTQIGLISKLKSEQTILFGQMQRLEGELDSTKEQSNEEVEELRESLREKQEELTKVSNELWKERSRLGVSIGITGSEPNVFYDPDKKYQPVFIAGEPVQRGSTVSLASSKSDKD